jgi:hypothetical protein
MWRSSQHTEVQLKSVANIPKTSIFPKLKSQSTLLPYDRRAADMKVPNSLVTRIYSMSSLTVPLESTRIVH